MSIETDISNALTAQTEALTFTPALPVSFPNVAFTPPDNARYLEVSHFRNTNISPTWGDEKTLVGIWQIVIHDPLQAGEIPAHNIASDIIDAFKKNTILRSGEAVVRITDHPTLLTMVQNGDKALFPVSIPYRVFKA